MLTYACLLEMALEVTIASLLGFEGNLAALYFGVFNHLLRSEWPELKLSIFRVRLSQRDREKLRWELAKILKPEDDILLVGLCGRCCDRVPLYNREGVWAESQGSFRAI